MEPTKDVECRTVDLVDAILNKGVVIAADVIVSVAGIPLIGINLRAALAGMETMLEYGMMEAWDESVRKYYADEIAERKKIPLVEGERIILSTLGSHYYNEGAYNAWRNGYLYLTDKRLFLLRTEPIEMLFETPLEKIRGMTIRMDGYFTGTKERLHLLLETGEIACLSAENVAALKNAIEMRTKAIGLALDEIETFSEKMFQFLEDSEKIVQNERVWYHAPPTAVTGPIWEPGWICVTNKRVCWCYYLEDKLLFEIPLDRIVDAVVGKEETAKMAVSGNTGIIDIVMNTPLDVRKLGVTNGERGGILALSYKTPSGASTALFRGKKEQLEGLEVAIKKEREVLLAC